MNAKDWTYAGEGGKHVLFAYRPKQKPETKYDGRLLRLTKKDLALSSAFDDDEIDIALPPVPAAVPAAVAPNSPQDKLHYMREIVAPMLGTYLDLPQAVTLEWVFVKKLRHQTLAKYHNRIPPRRQDGWTLLEGTGAPALPHVAALLLFDYKASQSIGQELHQTTRQFLSVEIKPKAGYLAISPLVDASRRTKYLFSRYSIIQQLYRKGHVIKPWMTGSLVPELSHYDPLDLFSGETARIRQAVQNLVACPQNNLKAWLGDNAVIGLPQDNPSLEWTHLARNWWSEGVSNNSIRATEVEAFFTNMITSMLEAETVLSDLLQLAKLDILDADGVILLYHRFVKLCGGSQDDAERILDETVNFRASEGPNDMHRLLINSPLSAPHDCTRLNELCKEIESFQLRLSDASPSLPAEEDMECARVATLQHLESLSIDECRFLLQNYLLSLAMCDVSLFLTFLPCSGTDQVAHLLTNERVCTSISRQQRGKAGKFVYGDGSTGIPKGAYLYEIKLIDCDGKPAKKLTSRHQKEEPLSVASMEFMKQGAISDNTP